MAEDDLEVIRRINELADEEHRLFTMESKGLATDDNRERLRELGVTLDQCWDLLHQRRALRQAGKDPDAARVRDPSVVEGYTG